MARTATRATGCGEMAGAGRGSMRETPRRRRQPTTDKTVSPVTCPLERRTGSTRPAIQPSSRSRSAVQITEQARRGEPTMGSEMREMREESMERMESMEGMERTAGPPQMGRSKPRGGHLYIQTNEIRNAIVHYDWSTSGALTEVERVPTGGAGSGTFKPISGQESAPNAFEGAGSVILTADRRRLFTTNGGDNSVSSFSVDKDGRLTR